MTDHPKKPSALTIGLSVAMTIYILYRLLFAGGEAMSSTLTGMYWVAVILNLIFLASLFVRRGK